MRSVRETEALLGIYTVLHGSSHVVSYHIVTRIIGHTIYGNANSWIPLPIGHIHMGQSTLEYAAVKEWNDLPKELRAY